MIIRLVYPEKKENEKWIDRSRMGNLRKLQEAYLQKNERATLKVYE